eukprot:6176194-Pleurochrysis_carterae.AAC.1
MDLLWRVWKGSLEGQFLTSPAAFTFLYACMKRKSMAPLLAPEWVRWADMNRGRLPYHMSIRSQAHFFMIEARDRSAFEGPAQELVEMRLAYGCSQQASYGVSQVFTIAVGGLPLLLMHS